MIVMISPEAIAQSVRSRAPSGHLIDDFFVDPAGVDLCLFVGSGFESCANEFSIALLRLDICTVRLGKRHALIKVLLIETSTGVRMIRQDHASAPQAWMW